MSNTTFGARRTMALLSTGAGVLMALAPFSIAGVAVDTEEGICDTRFVNREPEAAKIADTRYPIWRDTGVGTCETGPVGLTIIVR